MLKVIYLKTGSSQYLGEVTVNQAIWIGQLGDTRKAIETQDRRNGANPPHHLQTVGQARGLGRSLALTAHSSGPPSTEPASKEPPRCEAHAQGSAPYTVDHGPTFATHWARPHIASRQAEPHSASFAGAAPKLWTPVSPGSTFGLALLDAGTWNPLFKPPRHRRPQNMFQFKLSAFLVPAQGSVSRAAECVDAGR
ncbi:hypothetical protein HispidOSU_026536 [Sigmodon hispidus]